MKGVRTIALRLTGTKEAAEELEEMGEDTSDMIVSQSKMRELIMNATKVASNNYKGFDIQDELGRYKSTYEIMLGLSQIWDEIRQADLKTGDNRQNLLLESIAGKNRASIASSILQNPDVLQSVYEDSSTKAAGSALEENQKKLDSISGHLARLTNAWQELWANAANRDVINMFIDLGTTILNLINDVGGLQSAFTLLYGGTILKGLMTADSWLVKFVQGLDNAKASSQGLGDTLNNVFTNLTGGGDPNKETRWKGLAQIQKNREDAKTGKTKSSIADETKEAIEANKELAESEELVQTATEESTIAKEADMATEGAQTVAKGAGAMAEEADAASTAQNTDETNKNTLATEANTAAEGAQSVAKGAGGVTEAVNGASGIGGTIAQAVANPMTWLMAIPAVLTLISTIINSIKKQQQELIDGEKEAASTWQEAKTGIDEYAQKYQELHAQLQNTNLSEQDQINIKQQIYDLQKQITDEYGHAADGVNLVNGNLDEQLEKLRQIKAEEAKKNLLDNEKEYKNARKAMEQERSYDMVVARNAPVTQDAQDILKKYGYELKQRSVGMGTVEQYIEFKGDASDAEQALKDLYNEVGEFSEDERVSKGLNTFFDSISAATEQNNQVLRDHQEAYNAFLEAKIFDNDNLYGATQDTEKTAGEVLIQLEDAVNDYNVALQSGDTSQIEEAQKTFESLKETVKEITDDMGQVYARPFDDIIDNVNKTAETAYNFQKKMDDPKVHSMAESVFGNLAENKKISKETQDEILDTAGDILNMQRELAKAGLTDIISPLYDPIDKEYKTKFGNIDLNNRSFLPWGSENLKKYKPVWDSWNQATNGRWGEMPAPGSDSTVLGSRGEFGRANYEIAFTPLFDTGDTLELLDYNTVSNYLNDIVDKATDKNGNVDAQKLLTLDADPKSGKKLIAAYGKAAESYDKIMHYVGTDGAYTTALTDLKQLADDNGLSVDKMLSSMAQLGNRSGIRDMFKDALPSVTDVEAALADTTGQFQELQDFAQQEFNIDFNSPESDIQAFIDSMQLAGLVATGAAEEAKQSLDDVFQDVSGKIEKVNSLSSVISKGLGQGGLTFTKLLDEQGNVIESDVSKIRDAYQSMYDYDLGSLFEETATGIKLNMDAYRQLAQEEEASTKIQLQNQRDLLEARQRTLEKQGAPDTQIRQLQEQITELDMLAAAYDGATSATAKYLAQQNAADYGDMYEMFRDTTVKRADELMGKGMIGTEEFRSIAQLFSYDSLATASADKVLEAYQKGYGTVSKYITEDATVGMQTFLDDLVALPEEYGKFTKDNAGNYMIEFTEAQEDKLAEHLNVSKDMLESFYDMLNALGFNIHFFRDGTLNEFDKLNQNINDSKDRLKELKENANDPNLIPDDVLDFNIEDLNTVEQLEAQLNELKSLDIDPKVNPQEYEAWKNLLDQIQEKIDKVKEAEIDPNVSLKDYETADNALDVIAQKTEQAQKLAEKGVNVKAAVENDKDIASLANQIATWPEQIQTYMGFTYSTDPEEIKRQLIEKISGVEIPLKPTIAPEASQELQQTENLWSNKELLIGVGVDPVSTEAAKQQAEDTIGSAQPQVEVQGKILADNDLGLEAVAQVASNADIHVNLGADPSQATETINQVKADAEEGVKTPLTIEPKNSVQDAANQAGAQQGVKTTKTEDIVTNNTQNTTINVDKSQVDTAQQSVSALQAASGSSVNMSVGVSGVDTVTQASDKVDDLAAKNGKKVNITIGGNTAAFNKTITNATTQLTTLSKKNTTPAIKADNSKLMSAAEKAKSKLDTIKSKSITISAHSNGFGSILSEYRQLKSKSITLTTNKVTRISTVHAADGTAHSQGTVVQGGKAFAQGGNWGLPKAEKGALINELGSEIVVMPSGQWQILNGGDPTFANLPKGAIIFNHKQSEDLLKNGYVTGSHGKLVGGSFARGTVDEDEDIDEEDLDELTGDAFALGTTGWNGELSGESHAGGKGGGSLKGAKKAQKKSSSKSKSSGGHSSKSHKSKGKKGKKSKSSKSSSSSKAKDFLETLDAIEIQINRIDALFQKLDTDIGKTYTTFGARTSALTTEFSALQAEIKRVDASLKGANSSTNYLRKATDAARVAGLKSGDEGYKAGSQGASGVGLSSAWITKIQNSVNTGAYMTLNDVKDEGLWKKIQAYQTWYEKYVKLQQKKQDYINKLSQLTIQKLQLIQSQYNASLETISTTLTRNQNLLDLQTSRAADQANSYFNGKYTAYNNQIKTLQAEAKALTNALNEGVRNGTITRGSEEWTKWSNQIASINNDIIKAQKDIADTAVAQIQYVQDKWQTTLDMLETNMDTYEKWIDRFQYTQNIYPIKTNATNSNDSTLKYYETEISMNKTRMADLQAQANAMQAALNSAVSNNRIQKNSEEWKKWQTQIQQVKNEIIETQNAISQLAVDKLEHIQTRWESSIDHMSTVLKRFEAFADLEETKGYDISEKYYQEQIKGNNQILDELTRKASNLQESLNEAVIHGRILTYSEEWYKWAESIEDVKNEIVSTQEEIADLNNEIRQLAWDRFERIQDQIGDVVDEMDFLNGLIYENDLFEENGMVTDKGRASGGLIAQQYDLLMKEAQNYRREILAINEDIAKDPNNQKLIKQRNDWIKSQQSVIENARKQKEAMVDLAEKGIKKQIDYMSDLIDKYEEALDKQRDQEQYAKNIADKQKSISNLEKQLRSMGGDDSEEGRARRQRLQDQLKQAREDLQDTQEDKRLSDIKDMLGDMQDKYEDVLNDRLDNIDQLFSDAITVINQNGADIAATIRAVGASVGYNLTTNINKTYEGVANTDDNSSDTALVSGTVNGNFSNGSATTLKTAQQAEADAERARKAADNTATKNIASVTTTTVKTTTTTTRKPTTTTKKATTTKKVATTKKATTTKKVTTTKKKATTTKKPTTTTRKAGFSTVGGKWYYYNSNGSVKKGNYSAYGRAIKSNASTGAVIDGIVRDSGGREYYIKGGKKQTGWQTIGGKKYYFHISGGDGVMFKGLRKVGNKTYYFNSNGTLQMKDFTLNGLKYDVASKDGHIRTAKNSKGKTVKKYAKGTKYVPKTDMYQVDEEGQEVFINSKGKIYTRLEKGAAVLPHKAALNLLDGMSNPVEFIKDHMDLRPNKSITNTTTSGDTYNNVTFNLPRVTNYSEFMREAQKDPNFTKYIQEISIGTLNGNNSLKGNSIRFK